MDNIVFLYSLQALIHVGTCVVITVQTFKKKLRLSNAKTMIIAAAFICISVTIIEFFLERTAPFLKYGVVASVLWAMLSIAFAFACIKTHFLQLVFLVFFLINSSMQTSFVARVVHAFNVFPAGEISYIIISIVAFSLMVPLMWYLSVGLLKKLSSLNIPQLYFSWLLALPVGYFIIYIVIGSKLFVEKGWFGLIALLVFNLVTYLSHVAVLQMLIKLHETHVAEMRSKLSEQMVVMQKEQYSNMASGIEKILRVEHDFRHNLVVIKSLAEKKDFEGLNKYLENYGKLSDVEGTGAVCSNHIVDVIIKHYMALAQNENIKLTVSLVFPEEFSVQDSELAALFGNLLENAMESCRRDTGGEKFISIESKELSKSMVALKVLNSCYHSVAEKNGIFTSSKRSGVGIGTSTIRVIAEKNGGNVEFIQKNNVFAARVLLISN